MQTYKIATQHELEKFKDEYGYKVDGNLEVSCLLDLQGRLLVEGYIASGYYIKVGGCIESRGSIEAGYSIKAGHSIKAGGYIESRGSIKAGGYIESRGSIKAGGSIESGSSIESGGTHGISAGLQITCKGILKYGLKCFAGICTWRTISDEEKIITCGKHEGGVIEYGTLKETGLSEGIKVDFKIWINGKESIEPLSVETAKRLGLVK